MHWYTIQGKGSSELQRHLTGALTDMRDLMQKSLLGPFPGKSPHKSDDERKESESATQELEVLVNRLLSRSDEDKASYLRLQRAPGLRAFLDERQPASPTLSYNIYDAKGICRKKVQELNLFTKLQQLGERGKRKSKSGRKTKVRAHLRGFVSLLRRTLAGFGGPFSVADVVGGVGEEKGVPAETVREALAWLVEERMLESAEQVDVRSESGEQELDELVVRWKGSGKEGGVRGEQCAPSGGSSAACGGSGQDFGNEAGKPDDVAPTPSSEQWSLQKAVDWVVKALGV